MLDYGINFNVEEGKKQALREIEAANKEFQKLMRNNPLKIDFNKTSFNDLLEQGRKAQGLPKTLDSIGGQLTELRKMFRELKLDDNLEKDGDTIIEMFKELKESAGDYGTSLDQAARKQEQLSSDSLSDKLKNLSDRWNELSISQRKGSEGLSLIYSFTELSREADIYAGSLAKVSAAHNNIYQGRTVNQQLSDLADQWDKLNIAQRKGAEGQAVINSFKSITNAAGVYIGSIRDVIAEEDRLAHNNTLQGKLEQLEKQWTSLSIAQRKGAEGRSILDEYKGIQESAGIHLGTIKDVLNEEKKRLELTEKQNTTYKKQSDILVQLKSYAMNFLSVYGGIRLTKSMVEITGEFEAQRMSLQAILRDAQKGEAIFERIKDLAVISPYTFKDLVGYTKQLSAFSVPYNELYETTKMLADVSAGLGVDMSRMILAYGQVRSAAVLRGQELRQFTEAGIPLVDELARKFTELNGRLVEAGEVFDLISQRKVSFEMIKDIFAEMSGESGKFYNMQEKLADTLKGKVANLTDAFQIMLAEIGEKGSGVLKGAIDSTRWLMENYDAIGRILLTLVATYGVYRAAIIAASVAENIRYQSTLAQMAGMTKMKAITEVLTAKTKALNAVIMKNPYAIAAAALIAVVSALILFRDRATAAEKAQEALNKRFKEQEEYAEKERSEVTRLINVIKDEISTRTEKQLALAKLQRMYPDIFGSMDVEALKIASITKLLSEQNEQLEKRNNLSNAGRISEIDAELERLRKEHGTTAYAGQYQYTIDHSKRIATLEKEREGITGKIAENERAATKAVFDALSPKEKIANLEKANLRLQEMQGNAKTQEEKDFIEKQILQNERLARSIEVNGKTAQQEIDGWIASLKELDAEQKKINEDSSLSTEKRSSMLSDIEERRKELDELLKSRGWKEPKDSDINKLKKDREKAIKDYLDGIQQQVDEYGKKFNIYNKLFDRTGQKPDIDFDVTFNGEPDLAYFIKKMMQEIAGGKLNLNVDFLTSDFKDVIGDVKLDEQKMDKLKKMFDELRDMAFKDYESLGELFTKYATYVQKKAALDRKYILERNKLIDNNAEEGVLKEQLRIYREASDELVMEFAKKDKSFNDFVSSLADQSIDRLRFLLMELRATLTKETVTGGDAETIAMLNAKIMALEEELKTAKVRKNTKDKPEDSYRQWKRLQSVLSKVQRDFDEIGDSIGGISGEIISLAGEITTSTLGMVSGMVELANWSVRATEMAAEGVSKTIQTVEKASVILSVVTSAFKVTTKVWNFLSRTKQVSEKTIKQYNALLKVTNDTISAQKELIATMSGSEAREEQEKTLGILEKQKQATINLGKEYLKSGTAWNKHSYGNRMKKELKGYEKDLAAIGIDYDKFGSSMTGILDLPVEQLKLMKKEVPEFFSKLRPELQEYINTLIEIEDQMAEVGNITKEAFTGIDFSSVQNGMDEFITSADKDMGLLAQNFEDYMVQAMLNIIKTQYLTDALKTWYDTFSEMAVDGINQAEKEYLQSEYNRIGEEARKRFQTAADIAGVKVGGSNLTGIAKDYTQVTEDTSLILAGTLTSFRDKAFEYYNYMLNNLQPTMSRMLMDQATMIAHLAAIEVNTKNTADNTKGLVDRMDKLTMPSSKGKGVALNVDA